MKSEKEDQRPKPSLTVYLTPVPSDRPLYSAADVLEATGAPMAPVVAAAIDLAQRMACEALHLSKLNEHLPSGMKRPDNAGWHQHASRETRNMVMALESIGVEFEEMEE